MHMSACEFTIVKVFSELFSPPYPLTSLLSRYTVLHLAMCMQVHEHDKSN